ncbi:MAG: VWA domain-containing protein [Candidatus Omnitrophica bacterium]|nr:VWA domain-containing protein [Candidatus Omnitrophota bacterium]
MIFSDLINIVWIFIFVPVVIWVYVKHSPQGRIKYSSVKNLKRLKPSNNLKARHILIALRALALCLLVLALMRPQKGIEETKVRSEGIDIVLGVDVSGSMMAEDFVLKGERKNRLEAVKEVVRDFIKKRSNDRIGLVVFAGAAYMQCPLTLDYGVLLKFLDRIDIGMVEDGTAVGDGLSTALARLKDVDSKSKVVILLTDGINNAGRVDPDHAAEMAHAIGVKVYTIGAGSKGEVPYPARDFFGNKVYQWVKIDVDDASLQKIAEVTGGRYFRATDTEKLKEIYSEIDRLERTKMEITSYGDYRELFPLFALFAMAAMLIEVVLRNTVLRTLP